MMIEEIKTKLFEILSDELGYEVADHPNGNKNFPCVFLKMGNATRDLFHDTFRFQIKFKIDIFSNYDGEKEILEIPFLGLSDFYINKGDNLIINSNLKNKTKIKRIGYPITIGKKEEINGEPILYSETLYEFVKNNLVDMDDKEQIGKLDKNKKPEIKKETNKRL